MNIFLSTSSVVFGNDIIDLNDPDTTEDHLNDRFINKICTENEKEWFFKQKDLITLWKIWAIKESSYKVISRMEFLPTFRYKDFEIQKDFINTFYKNHQIINDIYVEPNYILALSYIDQNLSVFKEDQHFVFVSWLKKDLNLIKDNKIKPSVEIRKYVESTMEKLFFEKTKIYRKYLHKENLFLPPYLYFKKRFYPISLSHHGRFLLFSLALKKHFIDSIDKFYKDHIIKISDLHFLITEEN
jgi:phosphopantetheinyl transferase (holo-ACP synthase)